MKSKIRTRKLLLVFLMLVFAGLACDLPGSSATEEPAAVTVVVVTATDEPQEEETGSSATSDRGLNVREGPGTVYTIVGFLDEGTTADVLAKNSDGSWWQIVYPDAPNGVGWVFAEFTTSSNTDGVPVVQGPPAPSGGQANNGGGDNGGGGGDGGDGGDGGNDGGGGNNNGGGNNGGGGGGQTAPDDNDLIIEVNIKNESSTHNGVISYPNGDTQDRIFVNVSGFDSVTTSGDMNFTVVCTGTGFENVDVNPGDCNSSFSKFFTNDSDKLTIVIKLTSGSNAYVNWTLIVSDG